MTVEETSDKETNGEPDQQQQTSNESSKKQPFKYTRSYKACLTCRKRKAKCDLGENDNPPCMRCRRERRECVFEAERSWNKKRKRDEDNPVTIYRSSAPEVVGPTYVNTRSKSFDGFSPGVASLSTNGSVSSPNSRRSQKGHGSQDLNQTLIKTVLANSNDALTLLSQAAMQQSDGDNENAHPRSGAVQPGMVSDAGRTNQISFGRPPDQTGIPKPLEPETYRLWKSSKFVKMGWMSAEDAVRFVDLFYEKMAPLSPVVTRFYADHANHRYLLEREPMLCCAILFVSSRWHSLTGSGGSTRGYFTHDRLWKYFQHLLIRLVLGQEQEPASKLRNLGSIEALLLATEWHARGLYFPPDGDGWDSSLIDSHESEDEVEQPEPEANAWLQIVLQSVQRSDRMSWMFIGAALSLAHELEILSDDIGGTDGISSEALYLLRKLRTRRLLYLFANQLASRLGCTSMLPSNFDHKSCRIADALPGSIDVRQDMFLESWIELTKLLRSLSEITFPSEAVTQQLVQSGRYVSIVEHFSPLLAHWRKNHLDNSVLNDDLQAQLFIEYQYVRVLCNSVGMQAVCERTTGSSSHSANQNSSTLVDPEDRRYIEEVISGSCELLEKVVEVFGITETLAYAPVRILLRVVSGSMFLIKALAIGARQNQVPSALNILERTVQTLRSKVLDDMHLADRFAALLELHMDQIRQGSSSQMKQTMSGQMTRQGSLDPASGSSNAVQSSANPGLDSAFTNDDYPEMADWVDFSLTDPIMDGWFSMPSNPTLSSLLYSGGMSQWPQT